MNYQSEFFGASVSVPNINGHVAHTDLADHKLNVGPTEMFQHSTREGTVRPR